jgi:CDP-diacylglycerol--glycerol-3-phosphate 3-phosphatidyltransferase
VSSFSYKLLPSPPSTTTRYSYQHEDYTLHWPDPQTHPHRIHNKARTALTEFQLSQRKLESQFVRKDAEPASSECSVESDKVLVLPIIQAGQFDIREEETVLALLFRHLDSKFSRAPARTRPLVDLTSGYFGLYQSYQEQILASDIDARIVAAAPKVIIQALT